jgi:hypothetical protein
MSGERILIVGGGVAGLSAAHELAERGFRVTVYERRPHEVGGAEPWGGKARSYEVVRDPVVRNQFRRLTSRYAAAQAPRKAQASGPKADASGRKAGASGPKVSAIRPLFGEHGFRFFPAFYRHLPDTMKRIPYDRKTSVADKLIEPDDHDLFASYRTKQLIPFLSAFPEGKDVGDVRKMLEGTRRLGLDPADVLFYFGRLWQVLTSCRERRFAEYETMSWETFVGAKTRSSAYLDYFGTGSTRNLVAARSREANARIIAEVSIQTWMPILWPRPANFNEKGDRVLAGPTQDIWIRPWVRYLGKKTEHIDYPVEFEYPVKFEPGWRLEKIDAESGLVDRLHFRRQGEGPAPGQRLTEEDFKKDYVDEGKDKDRRVLERDHDFDFVILALPVEHAAKVLENQAITHFDEDLTGPKKLLNSLGWMSGVQFYLKKGELPKDYEDLKGHVNFVDSPWALTAILQSLTWEEDYQKAVTAAGFEAILSVCVSDWGHAGFNGKKAEDCEHTEEVAIEVWNQIVRALPLFGNPALRGKRAESVDDLPSFTVDDDVLERHLRKHSLAVTPEPEIDEDDADVSAEQPRRRASDVAHQPENAPLLDAEPLLVNKKNTWKHRPRAGTRIPNLLLAGDYVRTNTGLACMEGANESARAAVNEILERTGSHHERCQIWELPEPAFAKLAQARDRDRFERGKPWRDLPGAPFSVVMEGGSRIARFLQDLTDRPTRDDS